MHVPRMRASASNIYYCGLKIHLYILDLCSDEQIGENRKKIEERWHSTEIPKKNCSLFQRQQKMVL